MTDPTWNWGYKTPTQPTATHSDYYLHRQPSPANANTSTSFSSADYYQPPSVPDYQPFQQQWNTATPVNSYFMPSAQSTQPPQAQSVDPFATPSAGGGPYAAPSATGAYASPFPEQLISDPLFNTARQIGGQFAEQQRERLETDRSDRSLLWNFVALILIQLTNYLSSFRLKYYFAVDTKYVGKKLGVILFPFIHQDWTTKFGQGGAPLTAREDLNAPDLYIPLMAFITYVLVAGFVFGLQKRFSPEKLGMLTTNALFYLILENVLVFVTKYLLNISQSLNVWHALSYSSYKFVGMVSCLLLYLIGGSSVYYFGLAYCIFATVFFLLRSLKTFILDIGYGGDASDGRKRKLYLLLSITVLQSIIMWLLTSVTSYMPDKYDFAKLAMGLAKSGQFNAATAGGVPLQLDGEVDYEKFLKMP